MAQFCVRHWNIERRDSALLSTNIGTNGGGGKSTITVEGDEPCSDICTFWSSSNKGWYVRGNKPSFFHECIKLKCSCIYNTKQNRDWTGQLPEWYNQCKHQMLYNLNREETTKGTITSTSSQWRIGRHVECHLLQEI